MPTDLEIRDLSAFPTEHEQALAREASARFALFAPDQDAVELQIVGENGVTTLARVPASALRMFARLLTEMAGGNAVTLVPVCAELSTQQAADLLNVSRPYVIQLMEQGHLAHHEVGDHRRLYARDVLAYKARKREEQQQILRELTAEAQELRMGY